jgi:hypothetical protein
MTFDQTSAGAKHKQVWVPPALYLSAFAWPSAEKFPVANSGTCRLPAGNTKKNCGFLEVSGKFRVSPS